MFINKVCEKKLMIGFYLKDDLNFSQEYDWSFEAIAVAVADEIAQRYQDIVDSVAYKIIDLQSIVDVFMSYFSYFLTRQQKKEIQIIHKEKDPGYGCIKFSRVMIDMYIEHFCDTINKKTKFMRGSNSFNPTDFIKYKYSEPNLYRKYNDFEASFKNSNDGFQEYLRDMIIKSHLVQMSDGRASYMIRKIFESLISNPMQLSDRALLMFLLNVNPIGYKKGIISGELDPHMDNNEVSKGARSKLKEKYLFPDNEWKHDPTKYHILLRTICDFISGMTDHYAASYYQKLYGIRSLYNIN
jgi:dGTPase